MDTLPPANLVDLIRRQALATPEAVALMVEAREISFREFATLSGRIASRLRRQGVQVGSRVALSLERGAEALAVIVGVLATGAAYVPLASNLPERRRRFIVEDSSPLLYISDRSREQGSGIVGEVALWDLLDDIEAETVDSLEADIPPDAIAWILYTSGSTGAPKGVLGTHRGSVNRIRWLWEAQPFDADEVAFHNTGFGTVDSVWEIFGALGCGRPLRLFDDITIRDVERLVPTLQGSGIRRICLVPSLLATILLLFADLGRRAPDLRLWVASGEPLPVDLVRAFYRAAPEACLMNQYGLTESCADITYFDTRTLRSALLTGSPIDSIPIGRPIPGAELQVVDDSLRAVAEGEIGELLIGGDCLAAGYWNRPDDTAQRFVLLPEAGGRAYRTGDRVRRMPDGAMQYCGRVDRQVKIRGFRVEMDEVELEIGRIQGVAQCAVKAVMDANGGARLIAWISPASTVEVLEAVREAAAQRLPSHMVPSEIIPLTALPRTATEKIDRQALVLPATHAAGLEQLAPPPDMRNWLERCWLEILGRAALPVNADFFALGGDSLSALMLLARLRQRYGAGLDAQVVFDHRRFDDLAAFLDSGSSVAIETVAAPTASRTDGEPTSTYLRLHVLSQVREHAAIYNLCMAVRLRGSLNADALSAGLAHVARRHPILSSRLHAIEDGWRYRIAEERGLDLTQVELMNEAGQSVDALLLDRLRDEICRPIDLLSEVPARAFLLRLGNNDHVLQVVVHHAVADDWSLRVIREDLCEALRSPALADAVPLDAHPAYVDRERALLRGPEFAGLTRFWSDYLFGCPSRIELPTDHPRQARQSHRAGRVQAGLEAGTGVAVKRLAAETGCTPFVVLLTLYQVFLARYTGQRDIVVGCPVADRGHPDSARAVGCFVDMKPFRLIVLPVENVLQTLRRAGAGSDAVRRNQALPMTQILEQADVVRSPAFEPLFQTMFAQALSPGTWALEGLHASVISVPPPFCEYDIIVWLYQNDDTFELVVDYAADLFETETMVRFVRGLAALVEHATRAPETALSELRVLPSDDEQWLLGKWQGEVRRLPEAGLAQLIRERASDRPSDIAVRFGHESLTYGQLAVKSAQLARRLSDAGIGPGCVLGLAQRRSPLLIVSMLAALDCGAAYLPLDIQHPLARLQFMLEDARACALLVECGTAALPDLERWPVIDVSSDGPVRVALAKDASTAVDKDVAYVMYTSGSTGRPKGVQVRCRALLNVLLDMQARVPIDRNDVVAAITTISFDISGLELLGPLLAGARVHLVASEDAVDGDRLGATLNRAGVTLLQATPSTWRLLFDAGWSGSPSLKALSGGEQLPDDVATQLARPDWTAWNVYGPTETTIWSTAARILDGGTRQSVGRPLANTTIYVLDSFDQLAPLGAEGEIVIGGVGVAAGYLGRPELTAERFIANPFVASPHARMYRTGDRGRISANGDLQCLGRMDDQFKLRGYRIEAGEIESILLTHPDVSAAAAVACDQRLLVHVESKRAAARPVDFSLFFFGATTADSDDYQLYLQASRFADETGLVAVWTPERHFHEVGGAYPSPSVLSAALAVTTKSIQLRAGSVVLPLHDPIRVVEEWSVVDRLAHGRVGIAFASGWNPRDFILHPERFEHRRQSMWDQVAVVRDLWAGQPARGADGNGQAIEVPIFPRPVRSQLPTWITAAGPVDVFEQAGDRGFNVLTHLLGQSVEELAEKIAAYRRRRARANHDGKGLVTVMLHAYMAETVEEATDTAREPFKAYLKSHLSLDQLARADAPLDSADEDEILEAAWTRYRATSLIGSPDSCEALVGRLVAIGVDEIACLIDFGIPAADVQSKLPFIDRLRRRLRLPAGLDTEPLRALLERHVPDYMLPDAIVVHERLPLTPSGKVDRRQLQRFATVATLAPERPLSTATERATAALWQDVLGREITSATTSFFAAGGHSLLASRLVSRLRRHFEVDFPLRALFDHPTVAGLAAFIDARIQSAHVALPTLAEPAERQTVERLSDAQKRMAFLDSLAAGRCLYNTPVAMRLRGALDIAALSRALDLLAARHPLLRARISMDASNELALRIHAQAQVRLLRRTASAVQLPEVLQAFTGESFALADEPPMRAMLVDLCDDGQVLAYVVHHAVSDADSVGLINREIGTLYDAIVHGREAALPPPAATYADFVHAQERAKGSAANDAGLAYWQATLLGLPDQLELPLDHTRPSQPSYLGAHHVELIDATSAERLRTLAAASNSTVFMVMAALLAALLNRYASGDDIAIGVPVNLRPESAHDVVGLYLNTVVLRVDCSGNPTFETLLGRTRDATLGAFDHQSVPFEQIVAHLAPRRDPSRHPLFQVMLVMHDRDESRLLLPGLASEQIEIVGTTSKFDLLIAVEDHPEGLRIDFEYATDLFEAERIGTMARHMVALAHSALAMKTSPVADLPMLSDTEMALATGRSRVIIEADPHETVHGLFLAQVSRTPDAIAVVDSRSRVSYAELYSRASGVAEALHRRGVRAGSLVAVCLPPDAELPAALLGVLMTGAAYVPIDPNYPAARRAYIRESSAVEATITMRGLATSDGGGEFLYLDELASRTQGFPVQPLQALHARSHVIYTSGSTGLPKGVVVTHSNTVSMLKWAMRCFEPAELAVTLSCTSVCFDLSVFEIFAPLASGATVVMCENFLAFAEHPARNTVTLCNTVPSAMQAYLRTESLPVSVRVVNLAGEPLSRKLSDLVYSQPTVRKVFNLYGPTECTTYATGYLVPRESAEEPIIGTPLDNMHAYVLGSQGEALPAGVVGELHLGGTGVAEGYLGDADITAAKFIANPWTVVLGARMYATGDLARRRRDGGIEYVGRRDRQVKLHGFRVELPEIEANLRGHPAVENAVVVATPDARLVGYLVARRAGERPTEVVRAWLRERLPAILIPSAWMWLDAFPLTSNRKIDISALPAILQGGERLATAGSEMDGKVMAAWAQVLGHPRFGLDDNFFDVGGTSLLLLVLRAQLTLHTGRRFTVVELFRVPTVRSQAALLGSASGDVTPRREDIEQRIARRRAVTRHRG